MALSLVPMASLSLVTGTSRIGTKSSLSFCRAPGRSPLLHSSFLSTSLSLSFPSSFSGLSIGVDLRANTMVKEIRRGLQVRAGKKYQLCQTKRNRSRKSLARTHGFRRRMRTTSGRAVLKRRRAKGRKFLCTKTNPNSGPRGG